MKYVAKRILHGALLLAGVSVLSFLLAAMAPGDYYSALRLNPQVSSGTIESWRAQSGLNQPLPVRYLHWIGSVAHGDFGYSLAYGGPVAPLLWPRLRATLLLAGSATLLAWILALPLGIWAATRRGGWREWLWHGAGALLLSVPDLLAAIGFLVLAVETGLFPAGGMTSPEFAFMSIARRALDLLSHLALPTATLVLGMMPALARHVRASVREALDAPFALTARAQGIPRRRLLFRHVLPAALNPLISLFGVSLGTLLSASLLIEVVMGWPGLGPLFLEAVMARDFALALAVVMLSSAFLVGGNLLADLALYRADPRIRIQ